MLRKVQNIAWIVGVVWAAHYNNNYFIDCPIQFLLWFNICSLLDNLICYPTSFSIGWEWPRPPTYGQSLLPASACLESKSRQRRRQRQRIKSAPLISLIIIIIISDMLGAGLMRSRKRSFVRTAEPLSFNRSEKEEDAEVGPWLWAGLSWVELDWPLPLIDDDLVCLPAFKRIIPAVLWTGWKDVIINGRSLVCVC